MFLPSRNTLKEMNYLEIAKNKKSILSSVRFPSSRPWVKDVCARSSLKRRQVRKWGKQAKGQGGSQVRVWAQVKSHRGVLEWVTPHICPHPRRGKQAFNVSLLSVTGYRLPWEDINCQALLVWRNMNETVSISPKLSSWRTSLRCWLFRVKAAHIMGKGESKQSSNSICSDFWYTAGSPFNNRTPETHTHTHTTSSTNAHCVLIKGPSDARQNKTHSSIILQRKRNRNHLAKEDLHPLNWKPTLR